MLIIDIESGSFFLSTSRPKVQDLRRLPTGVEGTDFDRSDLRSDKPWVLNEPTEEFNEPHEPSEVIEFLADPKSDDGFENSPRADIRCQFLFFLLLPLNCF